jgi:two-component system, NarL family, sensor kinase
LTEPTELPFERRQGERRKEERERIRQFEQRIAAEQDERRRLALELHDGAVQSLAGIALMLDAVDHAIAEGRNEEARRVLATALEQHRATIQSLRDLSFTIEPVVLRDQGFEPAVRELADRAGRHAGVQVNLEVDAGQDLAERAQVTFYQLIRVALDQATGRKPTRVSVSVTDTADGGALLTVTDDGHLERRDMSEAFEERARALNGRVTVDRSDGGTTVMVVLPEYVARS